MQSDVTLVGGSKPAAALPTVAATSKVSAQAGDKAPVALAVGQSQPRVSIVGQSAAITEAKIALSADDAPTALSQAERVLKPYGVAMLPDPPTEGEDAAKDEVVEDLPDV